MRQRRIVNDMRSESGFAMLLTVLLGIVIFALVLMSLLMLLSMETRRAVAQDDTNRAFYAAEGAMNDTYIRLDVAAAFPPGWTGLTAPPDSTSPETYSLLSDPEVDIVRVLTYDTDGCGKYIEIIIEATAAKAKRKIVGRYYPNGCGAALPSATPTPKPTPISIKYLGTSNTSPPDGNDDVTVPAGSGYITKLSKNVKIFGQVGSDTVVNLMRRKYPKNPPHNDFLNERLWICENHTCPDFVFHKGDRVVVGVDPLNPSKLKSVQLDGKDDLAKYLDVSSGGLSDPKTKEVVIRDKDGVDHDFWLIPSGSEIILSPDGILDDDAGYGDRYNYLVSSHPGSSVTSPRYTNSPFSGVDTEVKSMVEETPCAPDGSDGSLGFPKDTNPEKYVTQPCSYTVPDPIPNTSAGDYKGVLLDIIYEDSVLTTLDYLEFAPPPGLNTYYYSEVDPDP